MDTLPNGGEQVDSAPSDPVRDPPWWLVLLRYTISVQVGVLAVALPMLPSINGIVAGAVLPLAICYGIFVALPAALVLRAKGWRNVWAAIGAGAALGLLPLGLVALFSSSPAAMVLYVAQGACAGLAAWIALKLQQWPARLLPRRHAILAGTIVACATAMLASAGTGQGLRLIHGPEDLTCHNIFRNGGRSFPVVRTVHIRMGPEQWPHFQSALSRIATEQQWSLADHSRSGTLGLSMCQDAGTHLSIQQWTWTDPPQDNVTIRVTAPQGGADWQRPTDELLNTLATVWPGAITVERPSPDVTVRTIRN